MKLLNSLNKEYYLPTITTTPKKLILIGIVLVLLLCFLPFLCNKPRGGARGEEVTGRDTLITVDTSITVTSETIWQKQIVYLPTIAPKKPAEVVEVKDSSGQTKYLQNVYKDSAEDETLKIWATAHVNGVLDSLKLKYKLKAPKTIENTKEVLVEKKVKVSEKVYQNGFYLGASVQVGPNGNDCELNAMATTKKDVAIGYGYGLKEKSHRFFIYYRLWPKKSK